MRCDDALAGISVRADGELSGADPTSADLDAHIAACDTCAGFAADVHHIRSRLRVEAIDQAPDLGPAVVTALRAERDHARAGAAPPARRGERRAAARRGGNPRLAAAAAVAALAGMAAGATFVGLGDGHRSPASADVPDLVLAAQHDIDTLDSRFTITEAVAGGRDQRGAGAAVGEPVERTFDGRLVYRAPESLALSLRETTTGLADADRADGRLVVDGGGDRWWQQTTRRCAEAAGRVRCPDEAVAWGRAVTGREPFSAATPVPLDLVNPVDSFTLSATPASLGERTIAGRRAIGVAVTAAQVAPLVDGLSATVEVGPVHPADRAELWLDDQHLVPLALVVRAADDPVRTRWAATIGAAAEAGEVVLSMTTTELRVNGPIDDDVLRIPPDSAPGTAHLDVRDAGFRPTAAGDPAMADVPVPRHLPAGFAVHRSGTVVTPGGPPVGVRSWSDGRAWLTVRATTAWPGGRLFGDLGPGVRPVDLGAGGSAYANGDGTKIGLHTRGLDVVVEGSVPPDQLRDVAADLGIVGRAVPDGWEEAATADLAAADRAVAGLLAARGLDGFGEPAVRVGARDGAVTTTQVYAGPGQQAFTLTQSPGGLLPPPSSGDETGVDVRGTPGRYSQRGGEVEWVEDGLTLSLRSDTLTIGDLLAIAELLEPAA